MIKVEEQSSNLLTRPSAFINFIFSNFHFTFRVLLASASTGCSTYIWSM
jgi:hypothetical protein